MPLADSPIIPARLAGSVPDFRRSRHRDRPVRRGDNPLPRPAPLVLQAPFEDPSGGPSPVSENARPIPLNCDAMRASWKCRSRTRPASSNDRYERWLAATMTANGRFLLAAIGRMRDGRQQCRRHALRAGCRTWFMPQRESRQAAAPCCDASLHLCASRRRRPADVQRRVVRIEREFDLGHALRDCSSR
jgi:hypothetical protein